MKNQIIIHAAANQTRVALIENGELAQLFIESPENQRTVGNIYLAEVHKVMAGIRAAFINMGTQKDAFLHFSDTGEHLEDYLVMLNGKEAVPDQNQQNARVRNIKGSGSGSVTDEQNRAGALLQSKQRVLVQIVKEPIGSKGPRVSTNITVAGRFLVLIPMGEYVAVSKRIRSHRERRRLRSCISSVLPDGFGVIVRTLAEKQSEEALHEDLKDVLDKWNNILDKLKEARPPALLHQDMDMTESLVRDLFAKDYSRILIDDAKIYRSIKSYVSRVAPNMVPNIELYKGSEHIFDYMKISKDVESVFSPRVKMPSGGYLIFEQTEAMYVVDVNSGRYAAKREQEENSLRTNLESAREIAKQLRLRDIGGIIVVDFIDLREDSNRKKVFDELKREFRKDRAKTNVLPMSDFGLVQITRQRIRPSVVKSVSKVCPMCGGSGSIVSQNTIFADIEGWLTKFKYNYKGQYSLDLHLNPYVKSMLQKGWVSQRIKWFFSYRLNVNLVSEDTLSMNDFKFMLPNSEIEITDTVLNDQPLDKAITEANLDEEAGRQKKEDDPGLDYFRKEQKKADGGQQAERSTRGTANQRGGAPDKKKHGESKSGGGTPSGGGRKERPDSTKTRRSDTKAKYFKSSKESGESPSGDQGGKSQRNPGPQQGSGKDRNNPAPSEQQDRKSSSSNTSKEQPGEKKSDRVIDSQNEAVKGETAAAKSGSSREPEQEDNSHLPSAIEVARRHRIEKEKAREADRLNVEKETSPGAQNDKNEAGQNNENADSGSKVKDNDSRKTETARETSQSDTGPGGENGQNEPEHDSRNKSKS
ncbi:Rne/Rng family ribonuclease [Balneolales bacterium ANBcel1]|nr:Rne/Rng family ribonuclease [Balneolales bacterium ANBcel1]